MSEHKCNCENPLVPGIVEVIDIKDETPDVKSFFCTRYWRGSTL